MHRSERLGGSLGWWLGGLTRRKGWVSACLVLVTCVIDERYLDVSSCNGTDSHGAIIKD